MIFFKKQQNKYIFFFLISPVAIQTMFIPCCNRKKVMHQVVKATDQKYLEKTKSYTISQTSDQLKRAGYQKQFPQEKLIHSKFDILDPDFKKYSQTNS